MIVVVFVELALIGLELDVLFFIVEIVVFFVRHNRYSRLIRNSFATWKCIKV